MHFLQAINRVGEKESGYTVESDFVVGWVLVAGPHLLEHEVHDGEQLVLSFAILLYWHGHVHALSCCED